MKQLSASKHCGHTSGRTIALPLMILLFLAIFLPQQAFANDSQNGAQGLAQIVPAKVNALAVSGCVCDCVYIKTDKIKNHRFFETSPSLSCEAIQGQACLGAHRGQSFRGQIRDCSTGPRDSTDIDTATWMNIAGYKNKAAQSVYN